MSIELDEKDVKAVASRRYWARLDYRKVVGYFLLLLALSVGLVVWLCKPWDYFALVPMLAAVGLFLWWCMGEKKAKEELVRQWKEDSGGS